MSKTTDALEVAVAEVIANRPAEGERATPRQRANEGRAFVQIQKLCAPRIRTFIKQSGLWGHREDAEQVCNIALFTAIESYDPEKAKFTTFVNWKIRGELQSLRFRVLTDQRPSAKRVHGRTISLHDGTIGADGEMATLEDIIEDGAALELAESGANSHFIEETAEALLDAYIGDERASSLGVLRRRLNRLASQSTAAADDCQAEVCKDTIPADELEQLNDKLSRNREVIRLCLFEGDVKRAAEAGGGLSKDRCRYIARKASARMAEIVMENPRFAMIADLAVQASATAPVAKTKKVGAAKNGILPMKGRGTAITAPTVRPTAKQIQPVLRDLFPEMHRHARQEQRLAA